MALSRNRQQDLCDIASKCVLRSCACFCLIFRAYNHGLKGPQKPKTYCDNRLFAILSWELRNIYHHHHPESKKIKSSEANSGSIDPYGRYGNAVETRKTISTIAILCLVKAIFEKRAATVEIDTFISSAIFHFCLYC